MIYFDNAATTGVKPPEVIKAVDNALKMYSANPGRSGHAAALRTAEAVYKVREKTADFFGAKSPENVVFTMNCTHSINCVLKGVLRPGDHVVISSLEHNAVVRPLKKIGVSFDVAKISFTDESETVEEFKRRLKPHTKMVFITAASNVFGKILPLKAIGKLCRDRGILFAVDAAQLAGVIPINMQETGIDFLCVAPHKGLYAPMGIGILITEKFIPNTLIEGGTGTNSLEFVQPQVLPERMESGTLNLPGIMGISAGIDYLKKMGMERIYLHEMGLIEKIYNSLERMPFVKLYTPYPKASEYAPVLSFNYGDLSSEETGMLLAKMGIAVRAGLHCAPLAHKYAGTAERGTVRVSVSAFNNQKEVHGFIEALKDIKNFKKV